MTADAQDVRWKQRLQNYSAAFAAELIVDGEAWMDMIEGRNLSVRTYNLDIANTLTHAVAERYAPLFAQFEAKMLEIAGRADA